MPNPAKSLKGKKFGRLKVMFRMPDRRCGQSEWWCICDCGEYKSALYNHLTAGKTRSCGCLRYQPPEEEEEWDL